ncbi:MEKHLA domain-containing protein [Klebsiella aerogenes]|uniref:MEKHLA domain-containing protein n=1 Tax=Klebsiella aerogenes TaxID=548 RepID=UPI002DB81B31|nr:MEKHLA domain-containing protein [Klebsiella aerogenes]MEB5742678.1 MEKHLA domain-containing protein [Klebsiella aerogenes]HBV9912385.1 MEKHLA domain-containing protein [Klebsiella aerogenes]
MENPLDRALIERIERCYQKLSGALLPCPDATPDRVKWLHEDAPYSLLAHGNAPDPFFIYANRCALRCFRYTREEFLRLPSRLSAASPDRQKRQRMLERLTTEGIVFGYSGLRITRLGESFNIYDGIVWQLTDDDGVSWGQGALFWLSPRTTGHVI